MSFADAEAVEQLESAGKSLLEAHSSTEELLSLVDRVEELLAKVEQSPSSSMRDALFPVMKALISDELFRHSDMDVKVSVMSCIAEITRITAPDAPYDDDHMKEIFQLSVAAFEKLSELSGRSYTKAVSILDVIARVRSSVIMLDLECDALVFEMFQHFLNHIRSNHPESVFSNMEGIMTMVLDESEDIPLDLISLLLDSVKKENQETSPISWKLGENVITNCAAALTPYVAEAVKSLGINVDDYAPIVVSICQKREEDLKNKSAGDAKDNLENDNRLAVKNAASDEALQETKELASDVVCPGTTNQTADGTSKPASNGTLSTRRQDNIINEKPSQILKPGFLIKHSKGADSRVAAEPDSSLSIKTDKTESEPDSVDKRRGKAPNSLKKSEKGNPRRDDSRIIAEATTEADKYESESVPRKRGQKKSSLKNPEKGRATRADSRGIAEPNTSLSIKEEKSELEPDSTSRKRGQKSDSLVNPEEGHSKRAGTRGNFAPNGSVSVKGEKSENEPDSIPKKRGRKPNSLMNPDEGYDHSWMLGGRRTLGYTRCRKSREKIPGSSPSGNSVSRKASYPLTLENVAEPVGLQFEVDGTDPKKDHPKTKGATLIQEGDANSPSVFKGKLLRAEAEEETLKKEPEDTISGDEKEQENSTKPGPSAKTNDETAVASEPGAGMMEAEDPLHTEEKLQRSTVKLEAANVNENLSAKRSRKGRKSVNSSSNKHMSEGSGLRNASSETGSKLSNGGGNYFEKSSKSILKKERVIGKEETSESLDFGELMVGRRIKVWWPMDKMFYKGVIDSYDTIKKRHKVCYDDGDVETLNMKNQRWETLVDDASAEGGQKSDLPGLDTPSPINLRRGAQKTNSDQKKQAKRSGQAKQAKACSSSKSTPRSRKLKTKSDQGTQEKRSNRGKQTKNDSSLESNPQKEKLKRKLDEGKEVGKADEINSLKADSSSKSKPQMGKQKRNSDEGKQTEKTNESRRVNADSSSRSKPQKGKPKRKFDEEKQAQAESSSAESGPKKGIKKRKIVGKKQADKADESKQANSDASSERIQMPAPDYNIESKGNETKSVDIAPVDNPAMKDKQVNDATKMDEGPKDDGQISAGDLEVGAVKITSECEKASPKTVASSEGKNPEADIGGDGQECANEPVEMSKGEKEE